MENPNAKFSKEEWDELKRVSPDNLERLVFGFSILKYNRKSAF